MAIYALFYELDLHHELHYTVGAPLCHSDNGLTTVEC
jgi:hypothetical protein